MKNSVKNPLPNTKPTVKTKRAAIQKEYYVLRNDVFEFIGVFSESSRTKLGMSKQATAEV